MSEKYNIFIEGIPGSGKSTLLNALSDCLPDYKVYREGEVSPVELAWCAYMSKGQYDRALIDMAELKSEIEYTAVKEGSHFITPYTKIQTKNQQFYEYMGNYEIYGGRRDLTEFKDIIFQRFSRFRFCGNLFECSFFQNIIEELMMFAMCSDKQIIGFYKELISSLDMSSFRLIRLVPRDIELTINTIKCERVNEKGEEDWYPQMMNYFRSSPYGMAHNISAFEDVKAHFERRIALEGEIIKLLPKGCCKNIESKKYDMPDVLYHIMR